MIFKVCGMKYQDNIEDLQRLEPDWIGFIFYERSARYIADPPDLSEITAKKIGVFVDAEDAFIIRKIKTFLLNGIQFHGIETPEVCATYRKRNLLVIKSFSVDRYFDFALTDPYEGHCDYFLFDTKGIVPGGTGKSFDWTLLERYQGETPFLLSGGINPDSVEALKLFAHPKWAGIDINSQFEIDPGFKNIELIQNFKYALFGR
ncbi:MAG: phosphoribosylanthranilate isomerase [Saprospiraceae bacterium]|nr:phosphoribosylanthranilate isomerase [Saprospiraceae bacterium]